MSESRDVASEPNPQSGSGERPPGRPNEVRESPSDAVRAAELLSAVWFATFGPKFAKRPALPFMGRDNYWAVVNLCSELARDSDANEVSELLEAAGEGAELVAVWCYLIDDASASVKRRWVPALKACRDALETPREWPKARL